MTRQRYYGPPPSAEPRPIPPPPTGDQDPQYRRLTGQLPAVARPAGEIVLAKSIDAATAAIRYATDTLQSVSTLAIESFVPQAKPDDIPNAPVLPLKFDTEYHGFY